MAVDDPGDNMGEVGLRFDADEFAGLATIVSPASFMKSRSA
jgi:hypothetical protein